MKNYILDTNVFIDAYVRYYAQDICPGFWTWLESKNKSGNVVSYRKVLDELKEQDDDLSRWALACEQTWFMPDNALMIQEISAVSTWVENSPLNYTRAAKTRFLGSGADLYLIAYAKGNGFTLVTQESFCKSPTEIKIPTICQDLEIPCVNLFQMLREEKAVMQMCGIPNCNSACHPIG